MTYFVKKGSSFQPSDEADLDIHTKLPPGNFIVKQDPFGNLFFEQIEAFELKGKLYGDTLKNTDRIIKTFLDRSASTGVMLNGEKGCGKTLLAKNLVIRAQELGFPTIVINAPWHGDKFNKLIQGITQPCVVLFDEFEKVYDKEAQEQMLTLLDGVFPSKKLFIITCNDKFRVDAHMRNRPGRIYYMIDFKGLASEFIVEYCEDNLKAKEYISDVCRIASLFGEFNFDMLKALVEEMNRFNEPPQVAISILNAKPEFDLGAQFAIAIEINGMKLSVERQDMAAWTGNPLGPKGVYIYWHEPADWTNPDNNENDLYREATLTTKDLVGLDGNTGTFTFAHGNAKITLTRIQQKQFNYYAF